MDAAVDLLTRHMPPLGLTLPLSPLSVSPNSTSLASPIQHGEKSAFRLVPAMSIPSSSTAASSVCSAQQTESFFLSAIQSLIVDAASDESASEAGTASDKGDELPAGSLLCQVCSDRASGFHYGVFACEGCKGFFRRSIQQKIQYRACAKSQNCPIVRTNRNRCQFCRLKKCVAVGMSRDAVRFGRVPKREKARMVEEIARSSERSQIDALRTQFEDIAGVYSRTTQAFARLLDSVWSVWSGGPGHCPLPFIAYLPAIKAVVEFANALPGFACLPQADRVALLKACVFDVLLVAGCARRERMPLAGAPLLAHSLALLAAKLRAHAAAAPLLAALALCSATPATSPLAPRLLEAFWSVAVAAVPAAAVALPALLADVRALAMLHAERIRLPPPQKSFRERHASLASLLEAPLSSASPPTGATCPMASATAVLASKLMSPVIKMDFSPSTDDSDDDKPLDLSMKKILA